MRKYDPHRTWRSNLADAPSVPIKCYSTPPVPGDWTLCGLPMDSPLGIPAGPLLDARWLLHYANLGFDWLVYKTVRTAERECYALPNLVPVDGPQLESTGGVVKSAAAMRDTWAVSFGMPSQSPEQWRKDVTFARDNLPAKKVLVVSVVGTQDPAVSNKEASLEQLADDFAQCAKWAAESGADIVEANLSCPNVSTSDGQLYQQPASAALVAERIREAIGTKPLVLKIGLMQDSDTAKSLLERVAPFANGLAMTNSIAARVRGESGGYHFDGQPRGICGDAIREQSTKQVALFHGLIQDQQIALDLIGVGGVSTADHTRAYLSSGAAAVGMATSAMVNPSVAIEIRRNLV